MKKLTQKLYEAGREDLAIKLRVAETDCRYAAKRAQRKEVLIEARKRVAAYSEPNPSAANSSSWKKPSIKLPGDVWCVVESRNVEEAAAREDSLVSEIRAQAKKELDNYLEKFAEIINEAECVVMAHEIANDFYKKINKEKL